MDDVVLVEFDDCASSKMEVDVPELGLNDGAEVPSKTVLELSEVTLAFTPTVPFETELSIPSFRAVSFVEFQSNQRHAEYSSQTASLPI